MEIVSRSSRHILERLGLARALRQPLASFGWSQKIGSMAESSSPQPQADTISLGVPPNDRSQTLVFPEGYAQNKA